MYAPRDAMRCATGSSIRLPCSIVRTPQSTARPIACAEYACAITYVPQLAACSTAASISSPRICKLSSGSRLRRDAARYHQLDLIGALPELVAHRLEHVGYAVGDATHVGEARAARALEARLRAPAEVAVAARLADWHARYEHARSFDDAVVDRRLQAPIAATRVANRGEAAHQHPARGGDGLRREQRQRHAVAQLGCAWIEEAAAGKEIGCHGVPSDRDLATPCRCRAGHGG